MPYWLDPDEQHAWRGLLTMSTQVMARLNRGLQEHGLSLADYDVLVALTDVQDRSLRLGELGQLLQWDKSRLSKQISRMSARGLVTRRECPHDKRGAYVDLTDGGRAAIESAAPEHAALVRALVFDHLDAAQVRALGEITGVVLQWIGAEAEAGPEAGAGPASAPDANTDQRGHNAPYPGPERAPTQAGRRRRSPRHTGGAP